MTSLNLPKLVRELRASGVPVVEIVNPNDRVDSVIITLTDKATDADRAAVARVLAAHTAVDDMATERATMEKIDWSALKAAVAALPLAQRTVVIELLRLIWRMAKAQGLTSADDPGA